MKIEYWFPTLTMIALFFIAFFLGKNIDRMYKDPKSVTLVAGETWDKCDEADFVIHADGHGTKMIRCYKEVTVDTRAVR